MGAQTLAAPPPMRAKNPQRSAVYAGVHRGRCPRWHRSAATGTREESMTEQHCPTPRDPAWPMTPPPAHRRRNTMALRTRLLTIALALALGGLGLLGHVRTAP